LLHTLLRMKMRKKQKSAPSKNTVIFIRIYEEIVALKSYLILDIFKSIKRRKICSYNMTNEDNFDIQMNKDIATLSYQPKKIVT